MLFQLVKKATGFFDKLKRVRLSLNRTLFSFVGAGVLDGPQSFYSQPISRQKLYASFKP